MIAYIIPPASFERKNFYVKELTTFWLCVFLSVFVACAPVKKSLRSRKNPVARFAATGFGVICCFPQREFDAAAAHPDI